MTAPKTCTCHAAHSGECRMSTRLKPIYPEGSDMRAGPHTVRSRQLKHQLRQQV